MRYMDLHIHTNGSDGENTALEIEKMMEEQKASAYAITDHDTIGGILHFTPKKNGIFFIPGIEVSVVDPHLPKSSRIHILGYGIDIHNKELHRSLAKLHAYSVASFYEKWGYLKENYKETVQCISEEEIASITHLSRNIGSPDLANLFVKKGITKGVQEAFDLCLAEANRETKFCRKSILPEEGIDIIRKASGYPVIAHPITIMEDLRELKEYILYLKEIGIAGVETSHYKYTEKHRQFFQFLCRQHNLLESGGTDYHGVHIKPDVKILSGKNNNVQVKQLSLVDEIRRNNGQKIMVG